jgi:pyrimidine deaminase RibD-like protein
MILNDFTVPKSKYSNETLDALLGTLCELVIRDQQENPDFNGWVGSAVIDPSGRGVTGVNYLYGNGRVHAERAAIDKYEEAYGELPRGSIVVTTLSPCCHDTGDNRIEDSCTDYLNEKHVKLAYCGYKDPTQRDEHNKFTVIISENSKIKELCKKFADTFLKKQVDENFADGKVKGKSRPGRVKKAGASCKGSVTSLRQKASNSSGERAKMYHWCANMKSGKKE